MLQLKFIFCNVILDEFNTNKSYESKTVKIGKNKHLIHVNIILVWIVQQLWIFSNTKVFLLNTFYPAY